VTVDNQSTTQDFTPDLMLLPKDESLDKFMAEIATPIAGPAPAWVYDTRFAGAPSPGPGQTGQGVIELTEGDWVLFNGGQPTPAPVTFTVSKNDETTAPDVKADVSVDLKEFQFAGLDKPIPAGQHVWKLSDTGQQPHFIVIMSLPPGTTIDQVMSAMQAMGESEDATPAPDSVLNQAQPVGASATLSAGATSYQSFDLPAGTYAAVCFFPDEPTGAPHVTEGMATVFTVQ
jgi:hypothetical protein